jgi:hypothetical protein
MQYPDENDLVFNHFYANTIISHSETLESCISAHLAQVSTAKQFTHPKGKQFTHLGVRIEYILV